MVRKVNTKAKIEDEDLTEKFSFFNDMKTGNKRADSGKEKEINTYIDTGAYSFNAIISGDMTKGFPGNRITMLAGEEAVGKTFFACFGFCKPLTDMGYFIYYIDTENSVTDEQLIGFGCNPGQYKIMDIDMVGDLKGQMNTILNKVTESMGRSMVNKHKVAFVIDSQGMLDSGKARADLDKGVVVKDMTLQQELKSFYKAVTKRLGDMDIPMLVTNHVYANVGGYGSPTKVAGGKGALYACSVILYLNKKQYKEGEVRKGTIITAKNTKSRLSREGLEACFYMNWDKGFNKWYGVHIFATEANLIEKYVASKFDKKGVVGPEKAGNSTFYVIKDPKITPDKWIVCKETELHKQSTIGTIFEEVNEHVKLKFKLKRPIDFSYDDLDEEEDLDVDDDLLVDAETAADRARSYVKTPVDLDEDAYVD